MSYLFSVLVLGFVVLVHEFGHFLAAKWMKIPVKIFSIGFGPKIWSYTLGGTEYRLSLFPLGGYVLPDIEEETDFFKIPPGRRIVMSLGGPCASLILPIVCLTFIFGFSSGFSFSNILIKPISQTFLMLGKMFSVLPMLFSKPGNLTGAVGIVAAGGDFISRSSLNWLQFMALISLNLTVLNLLPFPIFDGGKVVLYLLEKIHPRFLKLHYPLAIAGWIIMLGLMAFVTVIDLKRYIFGLFLS